MLAAVSKDWGTRSQSPAKEEGRGAQGGEQGIYSVSIEGQARRRQTSADPDEGYPRYPPRTGSFPDALSVAGPPAGTSGEATAGTAGAAAAGLALALLSFAAASLPLRLRSLRGGVATTVTLLRSGLEGPALEGLSSRGARKNVFEVTSCTGGGRRRRGVRREKTSRQNTRGGENTRGGRARGAYVSLRRFLSRDPRARQRGRRVRDPVRRRQHGRG